MFCIEIARSRSSKLNNILHSCNVVRVNEVWTLLEVTWTEIALQVLWDSLDSKQCQLELPKQTIQ